MRTPATIRFNALKKVDRTYNLLKSSRAIQMHKRKLQKSSEAQREGSEEGRVEGNWQWHQIQASKFQDPVTGEDVFMVIQTDVTSQVQAEKQLRQVLDAEHKLLEEIFPRQVLEAMTAAAINDGVAGTENGSIPELRVIMSRRSTKKMALKHEQVTVMFADIVGFTPMSMNVEPEVVMDLLNELYTRFDALLDEYHVYKVETIGDCYMVAGGLIFTDAQGYRAVQSKVDPQHAQRVFDFARAILEAARHVRMPDTGMPVQLRIGMHSGPVTSGVVGTHMPRFCLFGDTVNTASRLESTGRGGHVHASHNTRSLLGHELVWLATGGVELKGRGLLDSYYYCPQ